MLKDAQKRIREQTGQQKNIRCFFVEADPVAFAELDKAVGAYHNPVGSFHVHTFCGRFEDSVDAVSKVIGTSFALTFIDPTGWTGYEFDKVRRIVGYKPGEVLLNFMFDHVNRFTAWDDPKIEASFDGILGAGWKARLDLLLPRDIAVQSLFSPEFRKAGQFHHVLLTPIEKLADRPFFCIAYGTRKVEGLATYREVEFAALKDHGLRRIGARQAIETAKTGQMDMLAAAGFSGPTAVETQIPLIKADARQWLLAELRSNKRAFCFEEVWPPMIETFMLRKTDAGQVCVDLASEGLIRASWREKGSKRRTPNDGDTIELTAKGVNAA
ncbi:three-Cys-motif partner protein TcmP [Mesorhizobium sp. M1365]|uniref:three-Cys-motif partner protein TcmP n=1 Tax=Mesorhizobium sp. M1365 TaxID=2957090 RepID=UPI003338774F